MAMEVLRLELKSTFKYINESLIHKVSESKKKHDMFKNVFRSSH